MKVSGIFRQVSLLTLGCCVACSDTGGRGSNADASAETIADRDPTRVVERLLATANEPPTREDVVAYLPTLKRHDATALMLCGLSGASFTVANRVKQMTQPAKQKIDEEWGAAATIFDPIWEQKRKDMSALMVKTQDSIETMYRTYSDSLNSMSGPLNTPPTRLQTTNIEIGNLLEKARAALVAPIDPQQMGENTAVPPSERILSLVSLWQQHAYAVPAILVDYEAKSKQLRKLAGADTSDGVCIWLKNFMNTEMQ
jgi:hypothetical protein